MRAAWGVAHQMVLQPCRIARSPLWSSMPPGRPTTHFDIEAYCIAPSLSLPAHRPPLPPAPLSTRSAGGLLHGHRGDFQPSFNSGGSGCCGPGAVD